MQAYYKEDFKINSKQSSRWLGRQKWQNIFIDCWSARATRTSIVIDIFPAFLKPIITQLNLNLIDSPNVTVNISNVLAYFISFFTQKLIHFTLWSISSNSQKNRCTHQNTTNLFSCQKQTDTTKWLILSTYTRITDMCTNITEKNAKIECIRNSRNYLNTPRI